MCIKLSHDKKVKGGSQVKRKQRNSLVPNLTTFTLCLKQNSSKTHKAICFAWCRAEPVIEFKQSHKIVILLDSCSSSNAFSSSGWNTSIQAYRGRNKIISAVDKYYFIRSVPKHLHFSYYGMRAEAIFWTFNKYISFTLNAWKVQLPCPLPVCQVSHKKLKKEFCGFMFLSNSLFCKQHWILVYKLKKKI